MNIPFPALFLALCIQLLLFSLGLVSYFYSSFVQESGYASRTMENLSRHPLSTYNQTLGFGQIYCINIPARTDRRDAMYVMGLATDISIQFIDGIDGKDIDNRALVGHFDRDMPEGEKNGVWGCWRSHMNALNEFLRSGLETALIIEDDLDWDIHLKETLSTAAAMIKEMQSEAKDTFSDPNLPYGNNWDMIYLGNCVEVTPRDPGSWPHRIYKDPRVPEPDAQSFFHRTILQEFGTQPQGERLVMKLNHAICLLGYAVTRQGAMKLIHHLGMFPLEGPIDVHIALLQDRGLIHGYSVVPPFFMDWKSGDFNRDSDISPGARQGNWNIKDGIRNHIGEMLQEPSSSR
ncbi:Procollagen galactosyltransferase 1 [Neolecta irregularis DAH-3]|uniref:Procollagen galactosyltransferase 1 n=1 Tax=Neolecta irregularis (strain DAH-3) TaxID=1198029 RepID=A0A1U7LPM5_NEOID|nr:Procollagen galactosyltransferase 1 [Neolecta irregularis DAH-3]|eukprot:OLL24578.1 Procollagen galactosyltransferase 1 [Neolecta irregularis DAH-3]